MIYSLKEKFFDNIILLLLVLSTGGLLFVFNRNLASVSFLFVLIGVVVFFGSTLKRTILNSSLMTFGVIFVLGIINYYFAIVEQTANKYLFHLLTTFLSILTLLHFKNNRTSDVFLKAMMNLTKYRDMGYPFSSWLYRIATNEINKYYRDNKKVQEVTINEKDAVTFLDEIGPDNTNKDLQKLMSCIGELKEDYSTLIEMRFFDKMSFKNTLFL